MCTYGCRYQPCGAGDEVRNAVWAGGRLHARRDHRPKRRLSPNGNVVAMPLPAMTFEHMLPRLVTAYDRGILVPFLGAGMSVDLCPDWQTLIEALEAGRSGAALGGHSPSNDPASLIRRANQAIRRLAMDSSSARITRVREALYAKPELNHVPSHLGQQVAQTTAQTTALATLWWPLVVSTNYDDLFARAYRASRARKADTAWSEASASADERPTISRALDADHLQVLGRSRVHCADVLNALTTTVPSVLWAIHGYLARESSPEVAPLERELVVGHDEYRRLAHADPYYRRTFAEVWRRRSLFFLGSSIGDPHLLDLFSEIQEIHGTNPQPHFALVGPGSGVDVELLRTRFNILVVELGTFNELPTRLNELAARIQAPRPRATHWRFRLEDSPRAVDDADLEILHGRIPETALRSDEGVLISGGFTGPESTSTSLFLSSGIRELIEKLVKHDPNPELRGSDFEPQGDVFVRAGTRVYAIRPWRDATTRDLTLMPRQLHAAFDWASREGVRHLRMSLVGAGATRHFPAAVPLAIIVRAFRTWRRQNPSLALRVSVHLLDEAALFELRSGRLDIPELLNAEDLRLWIRIESPGLDHVLPEPLIIAEEATMIELAEGLRLPAPGEWYATLSPAAVADSEKVRMDAGTTLVELAAVPGATMTVRRL